MDPPRFERAIKKIAAAPRPPKPWRDGTQLPWSDPAFSERMLTVHLDQTTHMASRTAEVIGQHVRWLWNTLRSELPAGRARPHILDAGCGPGLYCHELARRGARATGIDFAPAPVRYARELAAREGLSCSFLEMDLTRLPADLAARVGPVDAVTIWFGEFNSFPPEVGSRLIAELAGCLRPGGLFVLEYQPYGLFPQDDNQQWQACERSVFSESPHIWLQDYSWDEECQAEINVHWIIDARTGDLSRFAQCHQAYPDEELAGLFTAAGLDRPSYHEPIAGIGERYEFPLCVARKPGDTGDRPTR